MTENVVVHVETVKEAFAVSSGLQGTLDRRGYVTLNDLKILVGEPSLYTQTKVGWLNLEEMSIRTVPHNDGYLVTLPMPRTLDFQGCLPAGRSSIVVYIDDAGVTPMVERILDGTLKEFKPSVTVNVSVYPIPTLDRSGKAHPTVVADPSTNTEESDKA